MATITKSAVKAKPKTPPQVSEHSRVILLNRLVSRSKSRAPKDILVPTLGVEELLKVIEHRVKKGWAAEYEGADDDNDEVKRRQNGMGHSFTRISQMRFDDVNGKKYAVLLFEHVNKNAKAFPVVNYETLNGRELEGQANERGATSAHVVIRLADEDEYDDGSCRVAIEHGSAITRMGAEKVIRRQLRRHGGWTFGVLVPDAKGKPKQKEYAYRPRLEFLADVGRTLDFGAGEKVLSQMQFVKRQERMNAGRSTDVTHQDYVADIDIRVSARQAPQDPKERTTWVSTIRQKYESMGYKTKLYFRHPNGGAFGGDVHQSMASAADLLFCPKETISLSAPVKPWHGKINKEVVEQMKILLDRDELWNRVG